MYSSSDFFLFSLNLFICCAHGWLFHKNRHDLLQTLLFMFRFCPKGWRPVDIRSVLLLLFYFVIFPHIVFVIIQNINMKILFSSNRRTDFIRSISTYCKSNLWHWTTEQCSSIWLLFFYLSLCLIRRLLASLHLSGFSIRHSLVVKTNEKKNNHSHYRWLGMYEFDCCYCRLCVYHEFGAPAIFLFSY